MTLGDAMESLAIQLEGLLKNGNRILRPLGIERHPSRAMSNRIMDILCRSLAESDFDQVEYGVAIILRRLWSASSSGIDR